MNQDLLALVVAALVFASGLAGLVYNTWHRGTEGASETRDLVNRLTGLVATLSALVLGLLIASANAFYNTQKAGLQTVSAKVLELDGVLRRYGPDAQPLRDILKDIVTSSYNAVWHGESAAPRQCSQSDRRSGGWIACSSLSMPCGSRHRIHDNTCWRKLRNLSVRSTTNVCRWPCS